MEEKMKILTIASLVAAMLLSVNVSYAASANDSAATKSKPSSEESINIDHLTKTKHKWFDELYLSEDITLNTPQKVLVEFKEPTFFPNWHKKFHREDRTRYVARVKEDFSEMFAATLTKSLKKNKAFDVVTKESLSESGAKDLMIVKVWLHDLFVYGPDFDLSKDYYVDQVGWAKVDVEVYRVGEDKPMLVMKDKQDTRFYGATERRKTNRANNYHEFKMLFKKWSKRISKVLADSK